MRRSFAGPRLAGLILLAASVAILLAVFAALVVPATVGAVQRVRGVGAEED